MIVYQLRKEIQGLIVCLFNPSAASEESRYTFETLHNYIQDCNYQLQNDTTVKRFPYHLSPCHADAMQAQEDFKRIIAAQRKEKIAADDCEPVPDNHTGNRADNRFVLHPFTRRKPG